jgi:small-conductance mechanosensitive channel/CRP-like cAMP-binding protein
VELWSTFAAHALAAWTPALIAGYLATRLLLRAAPAGDSARGPGAQRAARAHRRAVVRGTPAEYRLRAAGALVAGHVGALAIAAAVEVSGYEAATAHVAALACQAFAVVSLGTAAVFEALLPRVGLVSPRILVDVVTAVGALVCIIVVGRRAGFSVAGLITTSAVLTAVIGFSLQDTLGNVMGGLSLQLDKSIRVGDWIAIGGGHPPGQVVEIRWRCTAIQTHAWDTVIIPNSALVKSAVRVLGRRLGEPVQSRRQIDFFVDFRTPPTAVISAVEGTLRADPVPRMALEPGAQVLFIGVRDSYAQYAARYWLTDLGADEIADSAVRVRVWFALRRAGIPFSIPASSVFLTAETPARAERKLQEEIARRLAALGAVDLFRGLPADVQHELASDLAPAPFAAGEAITREGDHDDGLYMLVTGDAIVEIGHGESRREVARLRPGQFFGEMSLMTGEARTASVIAATDLDCYRIDRAAFERVLRATPAIADQIAEVLALRRSALAAARDEQDDLRRAQIETAKQDLVGKIRGFFGLDR